MRTGQPHSGRVRRLAPFGMRNPPVAGAGFHIVLQGSCWLFPPDGAPIVLGVGGCGLPAPRSRPRPRRQPVDPAGGRRRHVTG
ncbi:cupin domain-containing protein [Streptomyces sp. NPDC021093]|uniref:cupin domain-containing protein n=1 Tax=Streptomyces sp. NPDC021093 TaxID=3365112 RepID=UPI0037B335AC